MGVFDFIGNEFNRELQLAGTPLGKLMDLLQLPQDVLQGAQAHGRDLSGKIPVLGGLIGNNPSGIDAAVLGLPGFLGSIIGQGGWDPAVEHARQMAAQQPEAYPLQHTVQGIVPNFLPVVGRYGNPVNIAAAGLGAAGRFAPAAGIAKRGADFLDAIAPATNTAFAAGIGSDLLSNAMEAPPEDRLRNLGIASAIGLASRGRIPNSIAAAATGAGLGAIGAQALQQPPKPGEEPPPSNVPTGTALGALAALIAHRPIISAATTPSAQTVDRMAMRQQRAAAEAAMSAGYTPTDTAVAAHMSAVGAMPPGAGADIQQWLDQQRANVYGQDAVRRQAAAEHPTGTPSGANLFGETHTVEDLQQMNEALRATEGMNAEQLRAYNQQRAQQVAPPAGTVPAEAQPGTEEAPHPAFGEPPATPESAAAAAPTLSPRHEAIQRRLDEIQSILHTRFDPDYPATAGREGLPTVDLLAERRALQQELAAPAAPAAAAAPAPQAPSVAELDTMRLADAYDTAARNVRQIAGRLNAISSRSPEWDPLRGQLEDAKGAFDDVKTEIRRRNVAAKTPAPEATAAPAETAAAAEAPPVEPGLEAPPAVEPAAPGAEAAPTAPPSWLPEPVRQFWETARQYAQTGRQPTVAPPPDSALFSQIADVHLPHLQSLGPLWVKNTTLAQTARTRAEGMRALLSNLPEAGITLDSSGADVAQALRNPQVIEQLRGMAGTLSPDQINQVRQDIEMWRRNSNQDLLTGDLARLGLGQTLRDESAARAKAGGYRMQEPGQIQNALDYAGNLMKNLYLLSPHYHAANWLQASISNVLSGYGVPVPGRSQLLTHMAEFGETSLPQEVGQGLGAFFSPRAEQLYHLPIAGGLFRVNRAVADAIEESARTAVYYWVKVQQVGEALPGFLNDVRAVAAQDGANMSTIETALNGRQGRFDERFLYQTLRDNGVSEGGANTLTRRWSNELHDATRSGIGEANRVHFDYGDRSQLDDIVSKVIPFHIWATRSVPFYLNYLASNPQIAGALLAYDKMAEERQTAEGRTDTTRGMVPIGGGPVAQLLFGRGGSLYADPTDLIALRSQYQNFQGPSNNTPLGRLLDTTGRFGFSPWAGYTVPLQAMGLLGDRPFGQQFPVSRFLDKTIGLNPEAPVQGFLNAVEDRFRGYTPKTVTGDRFLDAAVRKRVQELSIERTQLPATEVPEYRQALTDPSSPIWREALNSVQRQRAGEGLLQYTFPFRTRFLGATEEEIRQAQADAGQNPDQTNPITQAYQRPPRTPPRPPPGQPPPATIAGRTVW